jgi:O-antigen/teichoic acid export membrane protein
MRRLIPEVTLRPKWHKSKGRMILAFAGWSLVISVAFRLIYFSDTLVVGSIVSVSAVAAYMVVLKIIDLMRSFVCPGAAALGVFVSEQAALGGEEVLGAMWVSGSKWSLAIMLPVWCACMLLPAQLIDSWVGSVFDGSQYALMWLASSAIIDLTQSTGYQILMNSGRHKPLAISLAGEAAANLVLSILLCKHMGIVGVAIGTFIPCTVRCCLFYPIYMSRLTGLDLRSYLRRAIWPAVVMSVPTCLLILSYALFHLHSGRTSMLTLIGVCAFSFGTSVLFLGADANQRARILNFLKRKGQLPAAGATKELSEAKELAATR